MEPYIFELQDVSFSYLKKYPALRNINMTIKTGQRIAVIGANGSGKSTLLQMLDGLIFPDQGTIKAFGEECLENAFNDDKFSREFRKKVGLVFQNPEVQLFCPTVKEDIVFGPLQLGFAREKIKARLAEISDRLGISPLLDRSPHQLSIGEKRKVAIASTLIIDPEVLILDEPTAGLDPLTTRHIIDLLTEAHESGKTVIIATHDLHIMAEVADVVYVFSQDKKLVKYGSVEEILQDTKLLQDNNLAHIHSHRHKEGTHIHPHTHLEHH